MTDSVDYSIYVGAADWRHDDWRTRFYPNELPEEWWLSFYNSQFRCVYLSHSQWQDNPPAVAETWLTDTLPNFRFVLAPPELMTERAARFLAALGGLAVMDRADLNTAKLLWFPPEPDLRLLGREIQQAVDRGQVLYLLSREAHLPAMDKVRSLVEVMGY